MQTGSKATISAWWLAGVCIQSFEENYFWKNKNNPAIPLLDVLAKFLFNHLCLVSFSLDLLIYVS